MQAGVGFSALQRAEIAEMYGVVGRVGSSLGFSALQRAEIAEIGTGVNSGWASISVSVLFNEPKLLKCTIESDSPRVWGSFSALQRAEIAEMVTCRVS